MGGLCTTTVLMVVAVDAGSCCWCIPSFLCSLAAAAAAVPYGGLPEEAPLSPLKSIAPNTEQNPQKKKNQEFEVDEEAAAVHTKSKDSHCSRAYTHQISEFI